MSQALPDPAPSRPARSEQSTLASAKTEPGFAALIRERTKEVHRAAERAGFIADLLHGRATIDGYTLFLRSLHPAYAVMEPALASFADHPLAGAFADQRLRRLPALESDLRALAGADWASLPLLSEVSDYAAAITTGVDDPERLSGHAYARYLGDLSGGQILKPLLVRTLNLKPEALGFYDFPDLVDLAVPKIAMRSALDSVPVGSGNAEIICQEAKSAFLHNIAISNAVQSYIKT